MSGVAAYVKTPVSIAEMRGALQAALPGWPEIAIAVLGAQWAVETDAGQQEFNFNPAGVTGSYEGQSVTPPSMSLVFRSYPDLGAGVLDWLHLLQSGYPTAFAAAAKGDIAGFAAATGAKYCGCDPAKYAAALQSRFSQWLRTHGIVMPSTQESIALGVVAVAAAGGLWWWLLRKKG
jgi:hypothetical protein